MKIIVLRARNGIKYLIASAVVIAIICVVGLIAPKVSEVFSTYREIPIYSVERPDKVVSITFDCAWEADDILDILSTLRKDNIKATFFIVGQWAEKYQQAVRMISEEGHDIANHSYSHARMGAIDKDKIRYEISTCGASLNKISGKNSNLFRAPYGDYNNDVINIAKELGYYTIQWDVDSLDWKEGITQEEILNRVMKKVKKGSIILFHNDTVHTAKMLPQIISELKNQGYGFLPLSQIILKENFKIDFEGRQKPKDG
jgi:peptidoglycan-N-acetylglucosamine deacetylase